MSVLLQSTLNLHNTVYQRRMVDSILLFRDLWFVGVCGYAGWRGGVGVGDKVSCWHLATPGKLMGQPRLEGTASQPRGVQVEGGL